MEVQEESATAQSKPRLDSRKPYKLLKSLRKRYLRLSALSRLGIWVVAVLPLSFLISMGIGAVMLHCLSDFGLHEGWQLMASAISGGALVISSPDLSNEPAGTKLVILFAGALGVGRWAFGVAVLSNSVNGPLLELLSLHRELETWKEHVVHFLKMVALAVLVQVVHSTFLGLIYYTLGGCDGLWEGFMMFASVQLGGGINQYTVKPDRDVLYVMLGVIAAAPMTALASVLCDPFSKLLTRNFHLEVTDETPLSRTMLKFAMLVMLVLPCILLLAMLVAAVPLAALTQWEGVDTFWMALYAVSGSAASLYMGEMSPLLAPGQVVLIITATAGFLLVAAGLGVGGPLVTPLMARIGLGESRSVLHGVGVLLATTFLGIPLLVFALAIPLALLQVMLLGLDFGTSLWSSVSIQLGGGLTLADVPVENYSWKGKLLAAMGVGWSIGVSILTVGVSSAPAVEPVIDGMNMSVRLTDVEDALHAAREVMHERFDSSDSDENDVDAGDSTEESSEEESQQ